MVIFPAFPSGGNEASTDLRVNPLCGERMTSVSCTFVIRTLALAPLMIRGISTLVDTLGRFRDM